MLKKSCYYIKVTNKYFYLHTLQLSEDWNAVVDVIHSVAAVWWGLDIRWSAALRATSINPEDVLWLSSFLENQQARVRFNGSIRRSRKVHQLLPQGFVLAPLLFVLYIDGLNKIPEISDKHTTDQETKNRQTKQ